MSNGCRTTGSPPQVRASTARRTDSFYAKIRSYWPGLADGTPAPTCCGVRPKIHGGGGCRRLPDPGRPRRTGLVNLFGIESPGLTASLAMADAVMASLDA